MGSWGLATATSVPSILASVIRISIPVVSVATVVGIAGCTSVTKTTALLSVLELCA